MLRVIDLYIICTIICLQHIILCYFDGTQSIIVHNWWHKYDYQPLRYPFLVAKKKPFYAECIIIFALNPHLWPKIPWSAQWGRVGHLLPPVNTCTSEWEALIFLKYLLQSKLIIYQQSLPVIICHLSLAKSQYSKKKKKNENTISSPPTGFESPRDSKSSVGSEGSLTMEASAWEVSTPSSSQSWSSSWNRCMASWCLGHVQGLFVVFFSK